ncbi:glycosyltransferase family 1 protein [Fulvivirga sp. RKSG066]|uniref:glycosyltransferase family 4 protein n=1 Tax=Fulvivirga aurantia TaxID=2529383 RepID=UPI0012BBEFAF|nr:glycosyltransferase family 4 protein [Fulvivirga aurantia]MTI21895.1 glycosyltransferase family 1 protein [Fulvivirga aurantia]
MKVLMIGPAKSEIQNYGLGLATENIAKHLSAKTELTIVSPAQVAEAETVEETENMTIGVQRVLLDTKTVDATAVHINISSALTPYFYHSQAKTETKDESDIALELQDALQAYNQSVIERTSSLEYDVIYAHDWLSIGAALQLKAKYNKPLVLHIHALDYDRVGKKTASWVFDLEKEGMQKADHIIAVSNYHAQVMQKVYGINEDKITVVHLGIDPARAAAYESPFKEKIILFAGRLSQQKGIFTFIEIAERLLAQDDNLRFIVAGDGELSQEVVSRVNEKGLQPYFNFTGLLEREALHGLMKESKVMVVPSVSEPFGLVALEAALNDLPLVISPNSGASEVLTGAFIPKSDSVNDYVEQVELVLSGSKIVKQGIAENTEMVAQRKWAHVGDEIFDIIAAQHE